MTIHNLCASVVLPSYNQYILQYTCIIIYITFKYSFQNSEYYKKRNQTLWLQKKKYTQDKVSKTANTQKGVCNTAAYVIDMHEEILP